MRQGILLPVAAVVAAMAAFQVSAAFAKALFPVMGPQGAAALKLGPRRPHAAGAHPAVAGLAAGCALAGNLRSRLVRGPRAGGLLLLRRSPGCRRASPSPCSSLGPWPSRSSGPGVPATSSGRCWRWPASGPWSDAPRWARISMRWASSSPGRGAGLASYILCGRIVGASLAAPPPRPRSASPPSSSCRWAWRTRAAAMFTPSLLPLAAVVALFSTVIPFRLEPLCDDADAGPDLRGPDQPGAGLRRAFRPWSCCTSVWPGPRSPASPR